MSLADNQDFQTGQAAFEAAGQGMRAKAASMRQRGTIDMIAGGIMTVVIVGIILNELLTLSIVNNSSGPFNGLLSNTIPSIGTAALTLVVLGFLAAGGAAALSMFRGGGF